MATKYEVRTRFEDPDGCPVFVTVEADDITYDTDETAYEFTLEDEDLPVLIIPRESVVFIKKASKY